MFLNDYLYIAHLRAVVYRLWLVIVCINIHAVAIQIHLVRQSHNNITVEGALDIMQI